MIIVGIDPGTVEAAGVLFDTKKYRAVDHVYGPNADVIEWSIARLTHEGLQGQAIAAAIERVECFGMPVGREVLETAEWVGKFEWALLPITHGGVYKVGRRQIKIALCGSPKAKDPHIRRMLLDEVGEVGTKKKPGPCYGISEHKWSALAVALTAYREFIGPDER